MPRIPLQHGFSLIEILVAVLVVAIGLLGVAGMQLVGLKGNHQSFSKNQAAHHTQALLERIRGNSAGVTANHYVFDSTTYDCNVEPAKNCGLVSELCDASEIAAYDLFRSFCGSKGGVVGGMKGDLSNAVLKISCPVTCKASISLSLSWDEQLLGQEQSADNKSTVARHLAIDTVIGE